MTDGDAVLGMTSLTIHIATLGLLKRKGLITKEEIKNAIDLASLLLEESGLALGEEGKAVHANLEMILAIVSVDTPQKPFGKT